MDGVFWVLIVGIVGWLTGKMIGETGYGQALGGFADGLDVLLGVIGAFMGAYLFLWTLGAGERSSFAGYTFAVLGSIALVGVVRLVSGRYLGSGSHRDAH
jgi:uncharacterized membrane protein YeaQ/YmgE (transglycosylase-associated protein family)